MKKQQSTYKPYWCNVLYIPYDSAYCTLRIHITVRIVHYILSFAYCTVRFAACYWCDNIIICSIYYEIKFKSNKMRRCVYHMQYQHIATACVHATKATKIETYKQYINTKQVKCMYIRSINMIVFRLGQLLVLFV
jgi:hypothetical protein